MKIRTALNNHLAGAKTITIIIFMAFLVTGSYVEARMTFLSDGKHLIDQHAESGWNILPCFLPGYISADSEIKQGDLRAIWVYIQQLKKYYQLYPENEIGELPVDLGRQIDESQVLSSSCWVYLTKSGSIKYSTIESLLSLDKWKIYPGWNFIIIMPDFKTKKIREYKGTCSIEKIAGYQNNKWEVLTPVTITKIDHPDFRNLEWDDMIIADSDSDIGKGILMYASSACSLNKPIPRLEPPPLPN